MKNKVVYLLSILCLTANVAIGQISGEPKDFKDCIGQDIFFKGFYSESDYVKAQEKAYVSFKGKYKPASKVKEYNGVQLLEDGMIYHIVGPITIEEAKKQAGLGSSFYHFISKDKDFYLPTWFCESSLRTHIFSCSFWETEFNRYQEDYAYMDTATASMLLRLGNKSKLLTHYDKSNLIHVPGMHLCPVEWIRYDLSADRGVASVKFYVKTNLPDTLILFDFETEKMKPYGGRLFVSKAKGTQAIEQNFKDASSDSKLFIGTIKKRLTNVKSISGEKQIFEVGDKLPFVSYTEENRLGQYKGLYLGKIYLIYDDWFSFDNPEDSAFLKRRKEMGYDTRMKYAKQFDSIAKINHAAKLNAQKAKEDSLISEMKKNEILILDAEYTVDYDYHVRCGVEFNVFNCYNKNIKYIDFTVIPYNSVGDIQGDDFNRKERVAHYIGPLKAGGKEEMSFSELFWDEHDAIEILKIAKIKVTFMDGTTKVYTGVTNVKKHALKMSLGY